jgi:hypothetical protein
MKSTQELKTVVRSGVQKKTECGMVVNAKAFEMLARQYSDPIKAILQEIGANAADSHVRAGIPNRQFDVKLPNTLDPHLRIRDYGIGMTKDVIYDVYINYMKSDKTSTNSETGFFGIGSKTPLAYADSFNIKTYNDGTMTLYTLGYNEHSIPELNEFASYETSEENGVEISFSVKPDDFNNFAETASKVYTFFDTIPNVTGNGSFSIVEYEKLISGDSWFIVKDSSPYDSSYVVMGNIGYPISNDQIRMDWNDHYSYLISAGIVVSVDIGDISITPSRESLEYSEKTIQKIRETLDKVRDDLQEQCRKKINDCKNVWQARLLLNSIQNSLGYNAGKLIGNIKYKEKDIPHAACPEVIRKYWTEHRVKCSRQPDNTVPINHKTAVVIKDIKSKFDSRSRHFCHEHGKNVYLVTAESMVEVMVELGCSLEDEVVYLASELPDPPAGTYKRGGSGGAPLRTTIDCYKFSPDRNGGWRRNYKSRYWIETETLKEDSEEFIYVKFHNYHITTEGRTVSLESQVISDLDALGIDIPDIYAVKSKDINKLSKKKGAITLKRWLRKQCEQFDKPETLLAMTNSNSREEIDHLSSYLKIIKDGTKKIDFLDSPFQKMLDFVKLTSDVKMNTHALRRIVSISEYPLDLKDSKKNNAEIVKLQTKLQNRYGYVLDNCLYELSYRGDAGKVNSFIEVINAIDFYKENKGN